MKNQWIVRLGFLISVAGLGIGNLSYAEDPLKKNQSLNFGQEIKVGDLTIQFTKVIADSRCPTDRMCIWAGIFVGEFSLRQGSVEKTVLLGNTGGESVALEKYDPNQSSFKGEFAQFAQYQLRLLAVKPERKDESPIKDSKYSVSVEFREEK